jgi:hypothetical protein
MTRVKDDALLTVSDDWHRVQAALFSAIYFGRDDRKIRHSRKAHLYASSSSLSFGLFRFFPAATVAGSLQPEELKISFHQLDPHRPMVQWRAASVVGSPPRRFQSAMTLSTGDAWRTQ